MYGLKPVPFKELSFQRAREARTLQGNQFSASYRAGLCFREFSNSFCVSDCGCTDIGATIHKLLGGGVAGTADGVSFGVNLTGWTSFPRFETAGKKRGDLRPLKHGKSADCLFSIAYRSSIPVQIFNSNNSLDAFLRCGLLYLFFGVAPYSHPVNC